MFTMGAVPVMGLSLIDRLLGLSWWYGLPFYNFHGLTTNIMYLRFYFPNISKRPPPPPSFAKHLGKGYGFVGWRFTSCRESSAYLCTRRRESWSMAPAVSVVACWSSGRNGRTREARYGISFLSCFFLIVYMYMYVCYDYIYIYIYVKKPFHVL